MAFGFQNCCDTEEYFYLNGIPATVSENEVYSISTLEGFDFCATYVELPELFYQPLTYNLDTMVEQTSCTTCLEVLPCPDTIDIVLDENVTISNYNECSVLTELPLEVTCNTPQPAPGATTGYLGITITGGQQPYRVYSANTGTQIAGSAQIGQIIINTQAPPGEYCYYVVDDYNAVVPLCCTVVYSPAPLEVTCSSTKTSVWANTGTVTLDINGGEPPYTTYYNDSPIDLPLQDLSAGSYELTTIDSGGQTITSTCTVTENIPTTTYPEYLCLSFVYCDTRFYLTFTSAGTENYLPYYTLNTPNDIAVSSMILSADTSFNWFTSTETSTTSDLNLAPGCTLLPSPGNSISFSKLTSDPSPLGEWISSGIFNSGVHADEGQCVDIPPTFTATGNEVCLLPGNTTTGTITILPNGGTPPYTYYINGFAEFGPIISNLQSGNYQVQISDSTNNLSIIQNATVSVSNPVALTFNNPCAVLNSNINSVLPNVNLDISSTIPTNNWPINVVVTGTLMLRLGYQYVNSPDMPPEDGNFIVNYTDTFPFIPSSTYILRANGTQESISFSLSSGGQWTQGPWTQNNATLEFPCYSWGRFDVFESNITLYPGDTIYTSYDTQYTTPYLYSSTCQRLNDITHLLILTNLEVQSGCATIDSQINIYQYGVRRNILPTETPTASYQTLTTSTFGLCAAQPNCNQQFVYGSIAGSIATVISNPYDSTTISTLGINFPRANTRGGGANNIPNARVTLPGGASLTVGQTYYFRMYFTSKGNAPMYLSFEDGQPSQTSPTNPSYNLLIPANLPVNQFIYYSIQYTSQINVGTKKMWIWRNNGAPSTTVNDTFTIQISACPWV